MRLQLAQRREKIKYFIPHWIEKQTKQLKIHLLWHTVTFFTTKSDQIRSIPYSFFLQVEGRISGTQGLLIALYSEITPGGAWKTIWSAKDQTQVIYVQGKQTA